MNGTPKVAPAGDSAAVVYFDDRLDPSVNSRALGLAAAVSAWRLPGVRDVVPAFHSVTVHYDPLRTDVRALFDQLESEIRKPMAPDVDRAQAAIEIPVCYDDDLGPDLAAVAEWAGVDESEVVRAHSANLYRVYMLGFLPGFAYLAPVDPRIAIPRLRTPRLQVPAGSVGIAGPQTGVYPIAAPGGWHLIGRTPLVMFDASRPRPSLLMPGDQVAFRPIERAEYDRRSRAVGEPLA